MSRPLNATNETYHGEQSTVNTTQTLSLHNFSSSVNKTAVLGYRSLCVVYQLRPVNKTICFELGSNGVKAYLIVSDGVTAKTASVIPAPSPAAYTHVKAVNSGVVEDLLADKTARSAHFPLRYEYVRASNAYKHEDGHTSESANIPLNRS